MKEDENDEIVERIYSIGGMFGYEDKNRRKFLVHLKKYVNDTLRKQGRVNRLIGNRRYNMEFKAMRNHLLDFILEEAEIYSESHPGCNIDVTSFGLGKKILSYERVINSRD